MEFSEWLFFANTNKQMLTKTLSPWRSRWLVCQLEPNELEMFTRYRYIGPRPAECWIRCQDSIEDRFSTLVARRSQPHRIQPVFGNVAWLQREWTRLRRRTFDAREGEHFATVLPTGFRYFVPALPQGTQLPRWWARSAYEQPVAARSQVPAVFQRQEISGWYRIRNSEFSLSHPQRSGHNSADDLQAREGLEECGRPKMSNR